MKKILGVYLLLLICATSLFAQSSYSELLKQAQQYEAEKKWISAAATSSGATSARVMVSDASR